MLGSQIVYIASIYNYTICVNNLGSQNVLEVTEPVLIIRPDDGPIGPKHVALNVLLMVIIRCVRLKINILCMKYGTHQYK